MMKKRVVLLCMLLVGSMSIVGCSNSNKKSENTNKTEDSRSSKNDSNENQNQQNNSEGLKNRALVKDPLETGDIKEEDIASKSKENIGGEDVTKYELKDGSIIIVTEDEDDSNNTNDDIKNQKDGSQDF